MPRAKFRLSTLDSLACATGSLSAINGQHLPGDVFGVFGGEEEHAVGDVIDAAQSAQGDVLGALLSGAALCLFDVATLGLSTFADWLDADRMLIADALLKKWLDETDLIDRN